MDKDVSVNEDELFYLKWHNFQKNVSTQFEKLREDEDLVDITFACDGKQIRAHKLVLFACSPYFKQLLKTNPCKHPVFYMNDVKFDVLKSILEYMYLGEVHISNDNLKEFIRVAEGLKIRGLTKGKDRLHSTDQQQQHQQQHQQHHVTTTPIEQLEFDSDLSQGSALGHEGAKRMKLDECIEEIPVDRNGHLQSNNHLNHHHNNHHQQQQQNQHQQSHQQQHNNSALSSHHQNHNQGNNNGEKSREKINNHDNLTVSSSVEPKVEMVEFIDGTPHSANVPPPPAYCQMTPLIISSSDKTALTLNCQPEALMTIEGCLAVQHSTTTSSKEAKLQHHHNTTTWLEQNQTQKQTLDGLAPPSTPDNSQQQQHHQQKGSKSSSKNKANCLSPHPCPVCSRLYSNVSNLRQHMRLIHNPTAVCCPICQKNFNSSLYLKRHYTSVHGFTQGGAATAAERTDEKPVINTSNNSGTNSGGSNSNNGSGQQSGGGAGQQHQGSWNLYESMDSSSANICQ